MLADHIGIPQLRDMANRSAQLTGDIRLSDMSRLAELLHPDADAQGRQIKVQIRCHGGAQGFPEISGAASGSVELRCQRCLGVLNWPFEIDFRVAVVESDADVEGMAEPFDTVMAGEHGVRLAEIVEDELLASLPLASMHEDLKECVDAEMLDTLLIVDNTDEDHIPGKLAGVEYNQPFAGLADMLKQGDNADGTDTS